MSIGRWLTIPAVVVAGLLLYLPLAAVALRSVNSATHRQSDAWRGATTQWYRDMVTRSDIADAALNTLLVATLSTLIAVVIGTLLAIALSRASWPRWMRVGSDASLIVPVVTPDIVIGIALVSAFALYRQALPWLGGGLTSMTIAHVTFELAFVALVVRSRLALIGPEQWEAARDLYASSWTMWRRVLLPQLMPGIVAGAGLAFILSIDDFMVSFLVATPNSTTLPIAIYGQLRMGISPTMHALSTTVVVLTITAVLIAALIQGRMTRTRSLP